MEGRYNQGIVERNTRESRKRGAIDYKKLLIKFDETCGIMRILRGVMKLVSFAAAKKKSEMLNLLIDYISHF
jgi:hypothetical protein